MTTHTIKFKRGIKSKLNELSYGEPAYISDENELYIGTEDGVEKITRNKEVAELNSQLEHKVNKGEGGIITNDMLSQEVKESMTGGSVAVVGKNAILEENIVDGQVTVSKTNFIKINKANKFDKSKISKDKAVNTDGTIVNSNGSSSSDFILLEQGNYILSGKTYRFTIYDMNKVFVSQDFNFKTDREFTISESCYLRFSYVYIENANFNDENTITLLKDGVAENDVYFLDKFNGKCILEKSIDINSFSDSTVENLRKQDEPIINNSGLIRLSGFQTNFEKTLINNMQNIKFTAINNNIVGRCLFEYKNGTFGFAIKKDIITSTMTQVVIKFEFGNYIFSSEKSIILLNIANNNMPYVGLESDITDSTTGSVFNIKVVSESDDYLYFNVKFSTDMYDNASCQFRGVSFTCVSTVQGASINILNPVLTSEKVDIKFREYPFSMPSEWKNKKWITLGDSITWQDGNTGNSADGEKKNIYGYQTLINNKLGFLSCLNKGISGRSISGSGGTHETSKEVDYTDYDLVVIAGGTNDFKLNKQLGMLGSIGDTVFDTNTFYGAYREMIEYILTQKPNIRICMFTPLQRDNSGYDVNFINNAGYKLIDYVNAIKELGEMYSIPVCDMYTNSGFTKLTLDLYTRDGLHPNEFGYIRMGNYASNFINNIGL